jgi:hypothetical protein
MRAHARLVRRLLDQRAVILAVLLAAAASLTLLGLPVYSVSSHWTGQGGSGSSDDSVTLLEANGVGVLRLLLFPLALALIPLLVPGARGQRVATWASTAILVVFVILSGLSIGLFYVPSALAMVWAASHLRGGQVEGV